MAAVDWIVEVDEIAKEEWTSILPQFKDAYVYQSWSYGAIRWGEKNLSHLVLRRNGEAVGGAQVRIMRIPLIGAGIAYVTWGPFWRRRDVPEDLEVHSQIFRALRREYAQRRGLLLRVLPGGDEAEIEALKSNIVAEGYRWEKTPYRTLMIDLTLPLEDLRRSMRKTWRQTLLKAERANLNVVDGNSTELFEECLTVFREMHQRKGFAEFAGMEEMIRIQEDLPEALKMHMLVCRVDGAPVAALVWSNIGETGIPILAATGDKALKLNPSHFLFWKMIQWMKDQGCKALDLGGVDRIKNPGGYLWKAGLAGKRGRESGRIGKFEACDAWKSAWVVRGGDRAQSLSRQLKSKAGDLRRSLSRSKPRAKPSVPKRRPSS